jgi:formate dehydrogenase assembly factor FdhD
LTIPEEKPPRLLSHVDGVSLFWGGQAAQPDSIIQQSDIDGTVNSVVAQLKTSELAALQKQVQSNERVADGSLQCKTTTQPNHKASDQVISVSVSVSVACNEEVFDFAAAQQMASSLLTTDQTGGVHLAGYKLVGSVIPSLGGSTPIATLVGSPEQNS